MAILTAPLLSHSRRGGYHNNPSFQKNACSGGNFKQEDIK